MAGDWIKVEKATSRKPEILRIAAALGIHPDHAFGACVRFWSWCDDNLDDGNAVGVTPAMLDVLLGVGGFADALIAVGWLGVRNGSLQVHNYDRHLSKNAKNRALSGNRAAKSRAKNGSAHSVTETLPEKRRVREEKNSNSHTLTLESQDSKGGGRMSERVPVGPDPAWQQEWEQWVESWEGRLGRPFDQIQAEIQMRQLHDRPPDKAKEDLKLSLQKYSRSVLDSDRRFDDTARRSPAGKAKKSRVAL